MNCFIREMMIMDKLLAIKHERLDSEIVAMTIVKSMKNKISIFESNTTKNLSLLFKNYDYRTQNRVTVCIGFITNYKIITSIKITIGDTISVVTDVRLYKDGIMELLRSIIDDSPLRENTSIDNIYKNMGLIPYDSELTFDSFLPQMTKSAR